MGVVASAGPIIEWNWVSSERSMIVHLLLQHIELTVIAVAVGLAIALPLGILSWKVPVVRPPLVGITGAIYVIPSVALLSLFAPVTGFFSITTAEVALVGYTLLILLRNTVAGLDSIPADAAGRGPGHGLYAASATSEGTAPARFARHIGRYQGRHCDHDRSRHRDRFHRARWIGPAHHPGF